MAIETARSAPYAPVASVLAVIRRFRERGLPETLTQQELTRVGVSEGNASRTLQALRFLDLVDDEGQRTPIFERLGRVSTADYPETLADIIRDAYHDVFTILNPGEANEIAIHDAFRHYKPQAQRERMVVLFMGLCREANLMPGGPPEARPRTKKPLGAKNAAPSRMLLRGGPPVSTAVENGHTPPETPGFPPPAPPAGGADYSLLALMLRKLPADGQWTQAERDRWLATFTANLDFLVEVIVLEADD